MGHARLMEPRVRELAEEDVEAVVELAVRIWEPVFASVNGAVGPELALLLHGEDWREHQAADTRRIVTGTGAGSRAWVAVDEARGVVGFSAAAVVDPDRAIGEVRIVGVAPEVQRSGLGAELTRTASDWLRSAGMRVAYVSTGGDSGHAPARALYERLGYTLFPSAQYFLALHPDGVGVTP